MEYQIREIRQEEYAILDEFLYEAIFVPDGVEAPPKSIIRQPELQVYVSGFGKKDDHCLVAEVNGKIIGAVWTRIMNDYGHVDDTAPSFAISLYKNFRGQGIGTALMIEMLALLRERGYKKASLSVQKANDAYRLYLKVGFTVVDENEEEYIMVCDLQKVNADSKVMRE
jgi:ribosomal protein S18 acetylase RimI-like enzyme